MGLTVIERRCPGCGTWHDKNEGACPMCGRPPARFNKGLRTAQLNSHLYGMAEQADRERREAHPLGV